jgi:putative PIN family toxin of toxin-antitoxin system
MKSKKIILDTNLWISFLISRDFSILDDFVQSNRLKFVFSTELLHEFITVAQRPKFKKYFSKSDLERIIDFIDRYGIIVEVKSKAEKCRDPKDNFLLNLVIDSKADYLVTGDNDLLEIKLIEKTKILTIKEIISEF